MTRFSGELPLTVVFTGSVGSPARAKVNVTVSVREGVAGAKRHFLSALSTESLKAASPESTVTRGVPEASTMSCAVTVSCFRTARAAAG